MPIEISGKGIEDIGDSLKKYIYEHVNDLIVSHFGKIYPTHVVCSKVKHIFRVDINVHVSKFFIAHCYGEDTDPYKSVRLALDKLETMINKHNKRVRDQARHVSIDDVALPVKYSVVESKDDGESNHVVIAEMNMYIAPMSVDEAVMRLEFSKEPLVVFKDMLSGSINIVYKRFDENIGWIDTSKQITS